MGLWTREHHFEYPILRLAYYFSKEVERTNLYSGSYEGNTSTLRIQSLLGRVYCSARRQPRSQFSLLHQIYWAVGGTCRSNETSMLGEA